MTKDMTSGSPARHILIFSVPLLIGNIFQQLYSMADTIIVGQTLGVSALAAVGATGGMSFLILGFVNGITGGFSVVTAQCFGAGNEAGVRCSVAVSTWLCALLTIALTALSTLTAKPLLLLMNTSSDIIDDAFRYIFIIFAGTGASVFYNMISSILRALGDSKTPLYFLIVASILNIVLDFLFILNFQMGVAGAAVATVVAQLIAGLLCLMYMVKRFPILRLKKPDWKFDTSLAFHHLRIGLPMALQFSITATGCMVLQAAINGFGSIAVAAYTAASKVQQLATQPMATFGITMATYTAQNLGANKLWRIRRGVNKCVLISIAFALGGALLVLLFGDAFVRFFISNSDPAVLPQVIEKARIYMLLCAVFYIPLGLLFIYRNALQGMGSALMPTLAGGIEFVLRTIVAFTLPALLGYAGACLADPIAWIGASIPLLVAYTRQIRRMTAGKNDEETQNEAVPVKQCG